MMWWGGHDHLVMRKWPMAQRDEIEDELRAYRLRRTRRRALRYSFAALALLAVIFLAWALLRSV